MAYIFTTHDGADPNGVRAEVRVEAGEGTILKIDDKAQSSQVSITADGLKLPVTGWVRQDDALYATVKAAQEAGHRVSFRIEVQRKGTVDRSLPIDEVRGKDDMKRSKENTTRILAAITPLEGEEKGVFVESREALTNPANDPQSSSARYKDTDDNDTRTVQATGGNAKVGLDPSALLEIVKDVTDGDVAADVKTTIVGIAIAFGANPQEVFKAASGQDRRDTNEEQPSKRTSYSTEAPAWKEWNSDGRTNLGHMRFSAGVGVEHFVREELVAANVTEEAMATLIPYYGRLVLSIADLVQRRSYGDGFRPDRAAASHARIRGVVYDIIRNEHPFHTDNPTADTMKKWVGTVGKTAITRYQLALEITDAPTQFDEPFPTIAGGNEKGASPVEASPAPVKPEPTPTPEPVVEVPPVDAQPRPEGTGAPVDEETPTSELESDETMFLLYPQTDISGIVTPKSGQEEKDELTNLLVENNIQKKDYPLISQLLRATFGVAKVEEVPAEEMMDFIYSYAAVGESDFQKVLDNFR